MVTKTELSLLLSDIVGIERMYSRRGLMVDRYPVRGGFDTDGAIFTTLMLPQDLQPTVLDPWRLGTQLLLCSARLRASSPAPRPSLRQLMVSRTNCEQFSC